MSRMLLAGFMAFCALAMLLSGAGLAFSALFAKVDGFGRYAQGALKGFLGLFAAVLLVVSCGLTVSAYEANVLAAIIGHVMALGLAVLAGWRLRRCWPRVKAWLLGQPQTQPHEPVPH